MLMRKQPPKLAKKTTTFGGNLRNNAFQ